MSDIIFYMELAIGLFLILPATIVVGISAVAIVLRALYEFLIDEKNN